MHEGGFEPPKRDALDLKSNPFDQTRVSMQITWSAIHLIIYHNKYNDNEMILFHSELIKSTNLLLQLGSNQRPIG